MTTLVLGVGHPDRGDDTAGPLVAELLRDEPSLVVRGVEADPTMVLTDPAWDEADRIVIVDTVRTGAPAGTVFRWDADELLDLIPAGGSGTHDLGVATTIHLARSLGRLPESLLVIGIEGARFDPGQEPSDEVLAAVQRVVAGLQGLPPSAFAERFVVPG